MESSGPSWSVLSLQADFGLMRLLCTAAFRKARGIYGIIRTHLRRPPACFPPSLRSPKLANALFRFLSALLFPVTRRSQRAQIGSKKLEMAATFGAASVGRMHRLLALPSKGTSFRSSVFRTGVVTPLPTPPGLPQAWYGCRFGLPLQRFDGSLESDPSPPLLRGITLHEYTRRGWAFAGRSEDWLIESIMLRPWLCGS